jgi:hypothetical protein
VVAQWDALDGDGRARARSLQRRIGRVTGLPPLRILVDTASARAILVRRGASRRDVDELAALEARGPWLVVTAPAAVR